MSIFDKLPNTILDEEDDTSKLSRNNPASRHSARSKPEHSSQSDKGKKKRHFSGDKFEIHGAFSSKEDAKKKEKKVKGSFIQEREIKGEKRFIVLKEK